MMRPRVRAGVRVLAGRFGASLSDRLLEVCGVSKAFGGVQALAEVSLTLAPGTIHALCGENGAGKSTLIRVISGACVPDRGEVLVEGRPLPAGDVRAAEAAGVGVIHQEPIAFGDLDAAENIFVGREPRLAGGVGLARRAMRREAERLLAEFGERLDLHRPVGELSLAQRQMVAIARALACECRVLILDEPTASLAEREVAALFRVIQQLRTRGVGLIYVSHRLEELFALAQCVTVLRDGRVAATRPVGELDRAAIIRLMVGRELGGLGDEGEGKAPERVEAVQRRGAEASSEMAGGIAAGGLAVEQLTRAGVFEDISFTVGRGEIVGLAGLVGAGRSEVARAIFGVDRRDSGRVTVDGCAVPPGNVRAALAAGLALAPEDRQQLGLVLPLSVRANLTLAILRLLTRLGLLSGRRERAVVEPLLRELRIRTAGADAPAWSLSGGNQQKLLLAKWLATQPRVLILDEPTRGVDVGAKAEVHRLIRRLAAEGRATLLISSDMPEILALCDRILVLRNGRIVGALSRAAATQERILALALPDADNARPESAAEAPS